jgi:hypothetical protein
MTAKFHLANSADSTRFVPLHMNVVQKAQLTLYLQGLFAILLELVHHCPILYTNTQTPNPQSSQYEEPVR